MSSESDETVLAFDIGGTWLRVAEVERDGEFLWEDRVTPARDYPADLRIHGRDERVLQKSLYESQEFLYRLVKTLSSPKPVT